MSLSGNVTPAEGRGRIHPTIPVSVQDPVTLEVRVCDVDVNIATAVIAVNDALQRAGCRMRSSHSCQGAEVEPGMVVGYIGFDSPVRPPEAYEEGRKAYDLLSRVSARIVPAMNTDLDIEVSAVFRCNPRPEEAGFLGMTLTVYVAGKHAGETLKEVWLRFGSELAQA